MAGCFFSLVISLNLTAQNVNPSPSWNVQARVFQDGPSGAFDDIAVKDPSIVFSGGQYHLFYTGRDNNSWRMGYAAASTLSGLNSATHQYLSAVNGGSYFAAPQVFWFGAKGQWYLIYQSGLGATFSTNANVGNPSGWAAGQGMGFSDGIDFWCISNGTNVYCFYSAQDGSRTIKRRSTTVANFPFGWSSPTTVATNTFEAPCVYRNIADGWYYMIVEDIGRYMELWRASSLGGTWTQVSEEWAHRNDLIYQADHWTDQVSHCEIIRAGTNELLEVNDLNNCTMLLQGVVDGNYGEYWQIPYDLGTATNGSGGGGNTHVWLEAECGTVGSLWNVNSSGSASNGQYVTIQSGNNSTGSAPTNTNGHINIPFSVSQSGTYVVWARVIAPNGNDDSFWIRMDGGTWINWNNIAPGSTSWTWDDVQSFSLSSGSHTLTIAYREDGAQLDKIYITNSGSTPSGAGSAATNCSGGTNNHVWLEAECGSVGSLWNTVSSGSASNGSYVTIQSGNNSTGSAPTNTNGHITYNFSVSSSGSYVLWCRVIAPTPNDDSFWIRMDGSTWINWNNIAPGSTSWTWDDVQSFNLSSGSHTLTIAYREDGTQLDKIYITNSGSTPSGAGSAATNCGAGKEFSDVSLDEALPAEYSLFANYPNPFNPTTVISFQLPVDSEVSLAIYNINGELVKQLASGKFASGRHEVTFDATGLASGVYFYRLRAGSFAQTKRMLLVK
jgi:hypothetical protein